MFANLGKSGVTAAMWFAASFMSFSAAIYGSETNTPLGLYFVLPMIVALVGTFLIWGLPELVAALAEREKTKRQPGDKLSLLMEWMDEDERAAFKEALKQRILENASANGDGELPMSAAVLETLAYGEDSLDHHTR